MIAKIKNGKISVKVFLVVLGFGIAFKVKADEAPEIDNISYFKEVRSCVAKLVSERQFSNESITFEDTSFTSFFIEKGDGRIVLADADKASIKKKNLNLKPISVEELGDTFLQPAESYFVGFDEHHDPISLISLFRSGEVWVSDVFSFTPGFYQVSPDAEDYLVPEKLFKATLKK